MSKKTKKKPQSKPSKQTAQWHNDRAVHATRSGDFETARRNLLLATAIEPSCVVAWRNLGLVYTKTAQYEKAIRAFRRATELDPFYALAWCGLGCARQYIGEYDGAMACYERALMIDSACANAHTSRAHLRLLQGDLARGFAEYSWRWHADDHARPPALPRWRGEDLAGKTLLVHTEQGFGDTVMFFRYLRLCRKMRPESILFVCEPELLSIFRRSQPDWADSWYAGGEKIEIPPPGWNYAVSVGDLPEIFGVDGNGDSYCKPDGETFTMSQGQAIRPMSDSYLFPLHPGPQDSAKRRTSPRKHLRVGIKWQGRPSHNRDVERSIPLELFRPLMTIPGVTWVSLQTRPESSDLKRDHYFADVHDAGGKFDLSSFEDAADCIAGLDLLVTVDTALAHLAGAMGAPVWNLIQYSPDWRWQLASGSTHWYPSMRLIRQPELGDWQSVIARVHDGIQAILAR